MWLVFFKPFPVYYPQITTGLCLFFQCSLWVLLRLIVWKNNSTFTWCNPTKCLAFLHMLFSFIYTGRVFSKLDCVLGFLPVSLISLCISVVFLLIVWKLPMGQSFYLYKSRGIVASTQRCCLNDSGAVHTLLSASMGMGPWGLRRNTASMAQRCRKQSVSPRMV